jgi:hypothetical protein
VPASIEVVAETEVPALMLVVEPSVEGEVVATAGTNVVAVAWATSVEL